MLAKFEQIRYNECNLDIKKPQEKTKIDKNNHFETREGKNWNTTTKQDARQQHFEM